jgi:predicted TIM-barrel fold metal-dependent hydrolase
MRIDIHVHLAGLGGGASGCFVSNRMRRSVTYHALLANLGLWHMPGERATEHYANHLRQLLTHSHELDFACVFAMDGVYDAHGAMVRSLSHLYVPNEWVFEVCRHSHRLLPVISINPERADALAELERFGSDAIAIKWLGPLQKFDPTSHRARVFYDALKSLELPAIIHSGCEHTFPGMQQALGDPALYEGLLQRGVPVIFSHCGTGSFLHPRHDYSRTFERLLERYDHVFGDTSAFCSLVRRNQLRRFNTDRFVSRMFHGSDWPIPSSALVFLPELGFNRVCQLAKVRHSLDRDVLTKRAMGVPDAVFEGAWRLLESRVRRYLKRVHPSWTGVEIR